MKYVGGCGRWCPFCWLERRQQRKLLEQGYWAKVNEKQRPPKV